MKMENHRANILGRIAVAWDKRPDLSLGELIAVSLDDEAIGIMSDDAVVVAIEHYVMFGRRRGAPET